MYNCPPKFKARKQIKDENKLRQVKNWNDSDINKKIYKSRSKKVHFDTTTRFLDACINFYKDEINYLLENGVDINCADKDNLTAIHQACINSRIDLVEYLLSKNANINVCDKEGWTPLHIAADIGSYELAKYLIDHGARLDVANYDGDLPITFVNESDYPDLKVYFQKEMDKRKINSEECSNHERVIMMEDVKKWKSTHNYDPPIDRINKSTPIHVAASKNYVEILSELCPLLDSDELNAQDIDGWTALHAAAHWGHREAFTILIDHGADLEIRTRANEKVLDIIDPELKIVLSEEIKKVQLEKEKTRINDIRNEASIRPDSTNRRSKNISRSSIVRQSVEWKKNFQMKDPVSERETLVKAGLNSDSSGIITIEECEERTISPVKDNKFESVKFKGDKPDDLSATVTPESNDFTKSFNYDSSECDKSDKDDKEVINRTKLSNYSPNQWRPRVSDDLQSSQIIQLSNGNNSKNSLYSFAQEIPISDSNNGALMNEVMSDTSSDSEKIKAPETEVTLRPRSSRDAIIAHRSTMERTSLVMAPAKSDEAEVMRREKARRVRSMRRSTQAIDLGGYKEVESKKTLVADIDLKADSLESDDKLINNTEIQNLKDNDKFNILNDAVTGEKKSNDPSQVENKTCDIIKKEDTKSDFATINKANEMSKNGGLVRKSAIDSVDSNPVGKRNPLKYQVSCPTPHHTQSFMHDRARLNISNTIKGLIKKIPTETQKPSTTHSNSFSVSANENPPGRGLNVKKCMEAGDSDRNHETSSKSSTNKYVDIKPIHSSDNLKERDSGSFVARPVLGNSNDTDKPKYYDTKHPLSISIEKEDNTEISSTSESSDANCLKDENQISKSILTRMLNDQTTKQELVKQIALLNDELSEIKEKNKHVESNLSVIPDKKTDKIDKEDKIPKLELEMSKLRDENKKLKSQNEALLRVISRIQQELESFRKVPLL